MCICDYKDSPLQTSYLDFYSTDLTQAVDRGQKDTLLNLGVDDMLKNNPSSGADWK